MPLIELLRPEQRAWLRRLRRRIANRDLMRRTRADINRKLLCPGGDLPIEAGTCGRLIWPESSRCIYCHNRRTWLLKYALNKAEVAITALLRGDDDATVLSVYPATIDEYGQTLDAVGRAAGAAGDGGPRRRPGGGGPARSSCVVTTAEQRARWDLPDLAASGRARVVDFAQAFGLLLDGAGRPEAAHEPPAGPAAAAAPPRQDGGSGGQRSRPSARSSPPARDSTRCSPLLDAAGLPWPSPSPARSAAATSASRWATTTPST